MMHFGQIIAFTAKKAGKIKYLHNLFSNSFCIAPEHLSIAEHLSIPHICYFFYTGRIFASQILHPKQLKTPKNARPKKNLYAFTLQNI